MTPQPDVYTTPRWVKVFAAVALLAVVLALVTILFGGDHGPGPHAWGGA